MNFRDHIPPELLTANVNADNFVKVLDALQQYKDLAIEKSARYYKGPINTNVDWLRKRVEDYGYPSVPTDFPKEILDAMLLNAQNVMALKGSKFGLTYWLWVLTFGEITIDDSAFYPVPTYIVLESGDDNDHAHFSSDVSPDADDIFLFSDISDVGTQTLTITINTKYHYLLSLQNYIEKNIRSFIHFTDSNATITITLNNGVYNTYSEPYQYFVIP